ncbi:MAG: DMT family transporter [Chitinophagales bacterium]|nr:DMT family transporter [Bacteroidota bacterium]MCB9042983.1 DMT family transporter [Chitinophagales bacterium]
MVYILLSTLCACSLYWIFTLMGKNNVQRFPAIVINYFVAAACGIFFLFADGQQLFDAAPQWLPFSLLLGTLFVVGFYLIAKTTQEVGVGASSVASKLSMIIPVMVAFVAYKEPITLYKILGISLALCSVFLVSIKSKEEWSNLTHHLKLPFVVLVLSGFIEILVDYCRRFYLQDSDFSKFLVFSFGFAGVLGLILLSGNLIRRKASVGMREIVAGIVLGIPNYFSIFFLLKALKHTNWGSSVIFPLNNILIILIATLGGYLFFGEKLTPQNRLGALLAVLAIVAITWQ